MPSSSVVVVSLYTLCVFVTLLRADYEVILDHKNVTVGVFSPDLPSTGLENADNPDANTYSIIGNFDAVKRAEYQIDDDALRRAYKLKLQFTYADGTTDLLEWTQTSWITESDITGFRLIQAIGTDGQDYDLSQDDDTVQFRGLGLNVGSVNGRVFQASVYSYLDGNGAYSNAFFQAVGVIRSDILGMYSSYYDGHGAAQSETLWIYEPGPVSPTTAAPTTTARTTTARTTTSSATQYAECRPQGDNCHIVSFRGVSRGACNSGFVSACDQPLTANCFLACNETSGAASAPGMIPINLLSIAVVVTMVLLAVNVTLICAQKFDKKQGNEKYRAVQFFASSEDEEPAQLQMQV